MEFVKIPPNAGWQFGENDAQLIAAAPELLAALIELRDLCEQTRQRNEQEWITETLQNADAAISRAGGGK